MANQDSRSDRAAKQEQLRQRNEDDVQHFFDAMTWDDRRKIFSRHLDEYLKAYDADIVDAWDLGDMLELYVDGFQSEYTSNNILQNVPDAIWDLGEGDNREDIVHAVDQLRQVVRAARSAGWIEN